MAIYLITGASGSGKTTIAQNIAKQGMWRECVSHTTRPMRDGEKDGITYYFVSKEKFKEMYTNQEFAEKVQYDGNYYGITKEEINTVTSGEFHYGKKEVDVFIIVEHDGYRQIKSIYPNAIGIFLWMTKEECLANMLLRGDNMNKALKRIETYDDEMKNRYDYDYVVRNVRNSQSFTESVIKAIIRQNSKF